MDKVLDFLAKEKLIPVVKIDNLSDTLPLMAALKEGGINVAEITFRTACGADAIELAARECKDMLIGAGTVINLEQAKRAVDKGAKFIVSPGLDEEVAEFCSKSGILYLPGCVTPTEIMAAMKHGVNIIKFFPAESFGGLKTIKALAAPFPQLKFVPTGGINCDNVKDYLAFDKIFACGGSWMVKDSLIKAGDFKKIAQISKEAKEAIK